MTKLKIYVLIYFIALLIFISFFNADFSWAQQNENQKCGNVILEGYLFEDCPFSAYFWLEEKTAGSKRCRLDIWLSQINPKENYQQAMEQSCISSETALTSSCFIAELLPQNEMLASWKSSRPFMELSKVTLVGEYKKLKVCFPSKTKMCTEPECTSCKEKEVFVPCQIVKSP